MYEAVLESLLLFFFDLVAILAGVVVVTTLWRLPVLAKAIRSLRKPSKSAKETGLHLPSHQSFVFFWGGGGGGRAYLARVSSQQMLSWQTENP